MSTEGPNDCGTAVEATHPSGTQAWSNESNAEGAFDGNYAATGTPSGGPHQTHYLKTTNFGFSIPSGATIDGIRVEWRRRRSGPSCFDTDIRIVKGGSISSTNKSVGASWPDFGAPAWNSFGGDGELWGESWTDTDINASTFGAAVAASITNFSSAQVDAVRITVWYTETNGSCGVCMMQVVD